jgi:hypothetical protein
VPGAPSAEGGWRRAISSGGEVPHDVRETFKHDAKRRASNEGATHRPQVDERAAGRNAGLNRWRAPGPARQEMDPDKSEIRMN